MTGFDPDRWQYLHIESCAKGVLSLEPMDIVGPLQWSLPPSKSHMIRWLILASQSSGTSSIHISSEPGRDISSMADCLELLGAKIERNQREWIVSGVGEDGFVAPNQVLDCGNSGTAARFLMAIAAGMNEEVRIDGDSSLKRRDMSVLSGVLRELGCSVSGDTLPLSVTGPLQMGSVGLDLSTSSQPLSAILLASPSFTFPIKLEMVGNSVSRGYYKMSFEISEVCGSQNKFSSKVIEVMPWKVQIPEVVMVPTEDSLLPIAMLISELHEVNLEIEVSEVSPAIASLAEQSEILNLRDESDLICPASALMAIGKGGRIVGAAHARGKESDRLDSTAYLLSCFGMHAEVTHDGLEIPGGQSPMAPVGPVETRRDHRLAMTAMALASRFGGDICNPEISAVSDPDFIPRLLGLGG